MKIFKIIFLVGFLTFKLSANAQEKSAILADKEFSIREGSKVKITATKTDLTLGLPYLIEVFAACGVDSKTFKLIDAHTVCDVKPKSIKLSSDKKSISVMIRRSDATAFNKATQSANSENLKNIEVKCKDKGEELVVSVADICKN